ncbi:hypothetical protein J132_06328 [Termitomyces sp. J132]|nr:hypothetical protein H2248_000085 [Termitomyces sp. 'cryptogamus']KNZ74693.1 hypothetical protein J132_06328 [Termitomyces sp. J132]
MTTVEIVKRLGSEDLRPTTKSILSLFAKNFSYLPTQTSPVSRLPNELLSSIFLYAIRSTDDRFETVTTPIIASQVSTRWRDIAISTAKLWNTIILTYPTSKQQLSRAVTWLKRSKLAPLDIFLDFRDPSWDWDSAESSHKFRWQDMETIIRLLMVHACRWKHFELFTDTWAPIFTFLCYTRHIKSVPLLVSLSLHRCNAFFASKEATFAPVEMRMPIQLFGGRVLERLRQVTLTGVHIDWSTPLLCNLTRLEFRYLASDVVPSIVEFTSMLRECRDLRHLTILGRGPRIDDNPVSSPSSLLAVSSASGCFSANVYAAIELPHVTDFVFGFVDSDYALKLLAKFSFPALRKLTLEGLVGLDPLSQYDLDAAPLLDWLLSHNSLSKSTRTHGFPLSRIHSLKFIAINADTSIISQFFNDLHELDFLGLYKTRIDTLQALKVPMTNLSTNIPPCVTLTRLECHDIDFQVLVDCVLARGPLSRLNYVHLQPDAISANNRERLLAAGVRILYDSKIPDH